MRRFLLIFISFGILCVVFQNCSAPADETGSTANSISAASSTPKTQALTLTCLDTTITKNGSTQLIASGGTAPYTFMISAGDGTLGASNGFFTAPNKATSVSFLVKDAAGAVASASLNVVGGAATTPPPSGPTCLPRNSASQNYLLCCSGVIVSWQVSGSINVCYYQGQSASGNSSFDPAQGGSSICNSPSAVTKGAWVCK